MLDDEIVGWFNKQMQSKPLKIQVILKKVILIFELAFAHLHTDEDKTMWWWWCYVAEF